MIENVNSIRFNALFKSKEYQEELIKLSKEIVKKNDKDFEIISKLSKEIQNGKENKKNINTLLDKIEKSYIRICNKY